MKLSSKNNELGTAALYCRLSRDDNMDTESNSISNQDGICQGYFHRNRQESFYMVLQYRVITNSETGGSHFYRTIAFKISQLFLENYQK